MSPTLSRWHVRHCLVTKIFQLPCYLKCLVEAKLIRWGELFKSRRFAHMLAFFSPFYFLSPIFIIHVRLAKNHDVLLFILSFNFGSFFFFGHCLLWIFIFIFLHFFSRLSHCFFFSFSEFVFFFQLFPPHFTSFVFFLYNFDPYFYNCFFFIIFLICFFFQFCLSIFLINLAFFFIKFWY